MTAKLNYAFSDLVDAWRSAHGDSDADDFYSKRYRAFALAFGTDLEKPPDPAPPVPEWLADPRADLEPSWSDDQEWSRYVHMFVLRVEEEARSQQRHPWSGMLEAPASLVAVYKRYNEQVMGSIERAHNELISMSTNLIAELYPDAVGTVVTADELRAAGFDPATPEPHLLDDM